MLGSQSTRAGVIVISEFLGILISLTLRVTQLGDGTQINRNIPVAVSGISDLVVSVAAGAFHTCAATALNVYCWGYNNKFQVHCFRNIFINLFLIGC